MSVEKLQALQDLVEDLLNEIDLENPVIENDDGEPVLLPTRVLVILGQMDELLGGTRTW